MACLHTLELLSEGFFLWVPLEGGRGGDCQSSMLALGIAEGVCLL